MWRPEHRLTGGERWPQGYLDPAAIRAEGIDGALQSGSLFAFWSRSTLYIVHACELVRTEVARTAPIAGFAIPLA